MNQQAWPSGIPYPEGRDPMPNLTEYHRPDTLAAALALLQRASPRTVPLAGGTWLTPRLGRQVPAEAVVDLSSLGLDTVKREGSTLRLGAMMTLAAVANDEACCSLADGILAQTARRDATVNVRSAATLGGTVVVAPTNSEFNLALLALGTDVAIESAESTSVPLSQFLAEPGASLAGGLVVHLRIRLPRRGAGGLARLARTPSDHPIVAAVAVVASDPDATRIAVGGVTAKPFVLELERGQALETAVGAALSDAELYSDFRGSASYRRAMGTVMARRALDQAITNQNLRQGVR
jgi:CO/xanthine dehydrogenase FAD-binding subunit